MAAFDIYLKVLFVFFIYSSKNLALNVNYIAAGQYLHFWSFHVFSKKEETEGNFPDNPSQNFSRLHYVLV